MAYVRQPDGSFKYDDGSILDCPYKRPEEYNVMNVKFGYILTVLATNVRTIMINSCANFADSRDRTKDLLSERE